MVLLVNKACALAERIRPGTPIDIREAADEVFICSRQGHSARTILDALCAARNMKPEIGLETISIEVGKYRGCHQSCGHGLSRRLRGYGKFPPVPLLYLPHPGSGKSPGFFACYRKDLYLTKYMRYLLELLHEVRNLPAGRHGQTPGSRGPVPHRDPHRAAPDAKRQGAAGGPPEQSPCLLPLSPGLLYLKYPRTCEGPAPGSPRPLTPGSPRSKTPWRIRDFLWSAGSR